MTIDTYTSRLAATRTLLPQWQVDALLITSASNRRWLSGFTGSAGSLLITATSAFLATDFRYWVQATAQAPTFSLYRQQPPNANWPTCWPKAAPPSSALKPTT